MVCGWGEGQEVLGDRTAALVRESTTTAPATCCRVKVAENKVATLPTHLQDDGEDDHNDLKQQRHDCHRIDLRHTGTSMWA